MIRPATSHDAAAIATIWKHYIDHSIATFNPVPKTADEIKQMIRNCAENSEPFLVADQDGIQGFATYGAFRGGLGYAHTKEHTIHLAPKATRQGLGHKLLTQIEDQARENNVHTMIAGISGENEAAIAFHTACGYTEMARLPELGWKFDRWHDLVLMQKIIE